MVALIAPSDLVERFRAALAGFGKSVYDWSPMMGDDDINDTSVGVISMNDIQKPAFNIDGSPMGGVVDIHGNPYGVTSA